QRARRRGRRAFPLQRCSGGSPSLGCRSAFGRRTLPKSVSARRASAGLARGLSALRRRKLHACAAGFRESDGDCLFAGAGTVLTLPNVLDLLADELACLCARRLALTPVAPGSLQCLSLRHIHLLLKTFPT